MQSQTAEINNAKSESTNEKNMNTHNHLIRTIDNHSQTWQLDLMAMGDLYKIYSPKKFELRPRDSIYVD